MNLFGLSPGELILILLVAMIVLGPEKLPEAAGSIGRWIREFRRVTAELTQQFEDENPFAEIQRALSLADEPTASVTPPAEVVGAVAGAEPNVVEAASSVSTVGSASLSGSPAATPRSDYFAYPSYYAAIDDAWTHSGLNGYHARGHQPSTLIEPISEDWIHGVPVVIAPPPGAEVAVVETSTNGSLEPAIEVVESTPGIALVDAVAPPEEETAARGQVETESGLHIEEIPNDRSTLVVKPTDASEEVVETNELEQSSESSQPLEVNGGHSHDRTTVEPGYSAPPTAVGAGAGHGEERAT